MDLADLVDAYYLWINKNKLSPLIIEVVRAHIDKIAIFITDKNGVTLMQENKLPNEKDGFDKEVESIWEAIRRFQRVLVEERGYDVIIPYNGKIKNIDY